MSLMDEWNKVKKNENNRAEVKKWALTKGAPKTQSTYVNSGGSARLPEDVIKAAVERNTERKGFSSTARPRDGRNTLPPNWRERNAQITAQQQRDSMLGGLIDRITGSYEPIMPGPQQGPNPNDEIMARLTQQLDQALSARLGAIGNVRNQAQQGYDTSDKNLAAMFSANANNIATEGSQRFGDITQDQKAGLTQTRDESLNRLTQDRNAGMAERAAMLQRLGIQEAAGTVDPGEDTLNNAMTGITNRSNIALQGAEQSGAANQAYNQSVVNSVNQQGTERRAALLQQLQSIQNELGMAEAEAQQQNVQQKSQLEMQRMQAEADAQGQSMSDMNEFGYKQFRDQQDLAMDLYKTLLEQEEGGGESADPTRVQGFGGLAQDLLNNGVPQDVASQYVGALSDVVSSEYMQGIHPDEGYDRASVIARRLREMNVPPAIAAHLATNYQNLGNNAYYNAQ